MSANKIGQKARFVSEEIERFDEYVEDTIHLYKETIDGPKLRITWHKRLIPKPFGLLLQKKEEVKYP
ncbi:MAG: hypothetical protein AB1397_07715 [bacterium]